MAGLPINREVSVAGQKPLHPALSNVDALLMLLGVARAFGLAENASDMLYKLEADIKSAQAETMKRLDALPVAEKTASVERIRDRLRAKSAGSV